MRLKFLSLSIALLTVISLQAQIKMACHYTANQTPTRWWWQGSAVDKPNLTSLMQQYKEAGLSGLEITQSPWC
ncbi:MAG: hypothetical protein IPG86_21215 [Chitinophagaceae bacterium]|nr:hypothetical protein [Chitinophagaceae bacterium]